jgi:hypothetical protein
MIMNINTDTITCFKDACGEYGRPCDMSECVLCKRETPSGACQLCSRCARDHQECRYCRRSLKFDRAVILADLNELDQNIQQWDNFFPVGHPARVELDHGLNIKRELHRQIRAEVESCDFATVGAVIQRYRELQDRLKIQDLETDQHTIPPSPSSLPPPPPSFPPPPPPPSESSPPAKPNPPKKSKSWRAWVRSWFSRGHN